MSGQSIENLRQILLRRPKTTVLRVAQNLNIRRRSIMVKSELIEAILKELIRRRNLI